MHLSIVVIFLICLVLPTLGAICQNPKVEQTSYTTVDGMVISDVAFITEFTLSCDSGKKDYILFADKKGKQLPALRSADNTKYQISWTESAESLSSGEHGVNVYDEAGYVAFKKAQRNSGDTSEVPSAFFLSLYHRGTYYGPWVSTEFIAATTSILLWYIAFSARSNLMSS
ncbi:translocon-associated protein subunit delta-like [Argiope bruennichi]|uniref:translocon-associated protein subunit delta-like n=1 Tax=Argiope bruennichi TaxID=94029 RepID=UPI00249543F1|nr:translocon-associated protein subunit delta-like [Argiope bruennichi]